MGSYIIRRLLQSCVVLFGVSVIVFSMVQMMPGSPALMILREDATPEQVVAVEKQLGLDKPLPVQYLRWLGNALRGNFGNSYQDNRPVMQDLLSRMPATLELVAVSVLISILIGIPIGVLSAIKRNTWIDSLGRFMALLGVSMPSFWLGLILILVFSKRLEWLPPMGRGGWQHVIMPAFSLGFIMAGILTRMVRSSMLEVLREDYLRTARAKGLPEKVVVFKHALRNAIIPALTVIALQAGNLLGGTVVIETIFAWPGVGRFAYMRMLQRDIPTIMGNLMLCAFLVYLLNIATDLLYAVLDPRIRLERGKEDA